MSYLFTFKVCREKLTFLKRNSQENTHSHSQATCKTYRKKGNRKRKRVTLHRRIAKSLYFQNLALFCFTSWFRIKWGTSPTIWSDPHFQKPNLRFTGCFVSSRNSKQTFSIHIFHYPDCIHFYTTSRSLNSFQSLENLVIPCISNF